MSAAPFQDEIPAVGPLLILVLGGLHDAAVGAPAHRLKGLEESEDEVSRSLPPAIAVGVPRLVAQLELIGVAVPGGGLEVALALDGGAGCADGVLGECLVGAVEADDVLAGDGDGKPEGTGAGGQGAGGGRGGVGGGRGRHVLEDDGVLGAYADAVAEACDEKPVARVEVGEDVADEATRGDGRCVSLCAPGLAAKAVCMRCRLRLITGDAGGPGVCDDGLELAGEGVGDVEEAQDVVLVEGYGRVRRHDLGFGVLG